MDTFKVYFDRIIVKFIINTLKLYHYLSFLKKFKAVACLYNVGFTRHDARAEVLEQTGGLRRGVVRGGTFPARLKTRIKCG